MPVTEGAWRKSTHSVGNGCVEVASFGDHIGVRDSKDRNGPSLLFAPEEWQAFVNEARRGKFDFLRDLDTE
jgi:Domain of unknown function (DUF397)